MKSLARKYTLSHQTWQRFAEQLRDYLRSYDVIDFYLLGNIPKSHMDTRGHLEDARLDVWSAGGCYVLAKALQLWLGEGRILFVPSDDVGGFEHAFLEVWSANGPVFLDDSGRAWRKTATKAGIAHRFLNGRKRVTVVDAWPSPIEAWQTKAAKQLVRGLTLKFGTADSALLGQP